MGAIGLNPIRLDRIGLDPIRINAIKLGVPGAASGTDRPYIDPEVLASLKAVCICYGKSNDDPDRAVVKNLVDPDNPFVISNAAFKLNSGFGKYEVDFTVYNNQNVLVSPNKIVSIAGREFISLLPYTELSKTISSYKIKVTGLIGELSYWYRNQDGSESRIIITKDGIYQLSTCYNVENGQGSSVGFNGYSESSCTIEQIPSFEGAFVTDGIDDLITSTKSATEMLDGSNEVTVVSMIHQIKTNDDTTRNNWLFTPVSYLENRIVKDKTGKTGIYGYTSTNVTGAQISDITPILGDKNDYTLYSKIEHGDIDYFSVEGFQNEGIWYTSSVAWYWTIIANKVLTTDQINQVIAYFNLDRTLKPDILCDVKKQGITNENHAEFGDKLIDFSGNGRDIQLNNLAWDGDSGIGKYNYPNWKVTATIANTYSTIVNYPTVNGTYSINVNGVSELMQSIGLHLEIKYTTSTGIIYNDIKQDGVYSYILPDGATDLTLRFGGIPGIVNEPCNITITQIPSHAGALCLDGVNDFGKVTGMPIYKDYTFIAEREFLSTPDDFVNAGSIVSKMHEIGKGSFIFETFTKTQAREVSFSSTTDFDNPNTERIISYQSKYSYNGKVLTAGQVEDEDVMWLGTIRDNDTRFINAAIYSLMSFPYSMSEFLIERQLKKHKLGTLYPDMVEFRPVIKANANYKITYYQIDSTNTWKSIKLGDYIVIGAKLAFQITFDNDASELKEVVSPQLSGVIVEKRPSNPGYNIYSYITSKSPQKINITIDEYIRYEDIVQPYPVLLRFNDENGNEVSWGGKFKVGSTITRIGSIADPESNLLNGLYSISGLSLNGKSVTSSTSIVEKQMVFKTTTTYLLDNNEPKCILSPRLLRIPNSSYKILGYIPDISGHGNHGKINNSAYAKMSGANGYKQDFTSWRTNGSGYSIVTDSKYVLTDEKAITNGGYFLWNRLAKDSFKVKISNIPNGGWMSYRYRITEEDTQLSSLFIREDGIYTLPATVAGSDVDFFISTVSAPAKDWIGLTIEQIGEYEGAYCLDGVDDFVTIPTLSNGGKQVLMKVNWDKTIADAILYDQRGYPNEFAIYNADVDNNNNPVFAYQARNNGQTYIDGILNKNIKASELRAITHNITITNELSTGTNTFSPVIGSNRVHDAYFTNMALYDFMLFDNISTEDKIKELNEYIGIEPKVELPPYYWDTYGKTNFDADRDTIQQRGIAVGDYDLTNYNHAYDKMSGYGGYAFAKFDNTSEWIYTNNSDTIEVVNRDGYDVVLRKVGNGTNYWHFRNTIIKSLGQDIQIGVYANKSVQIVWQLKYKLEGETDYNTLAIASPTIEGNINTYVTLPYKTEQEIADLNAIDTYYSIYFIPIDLNIDEEVTIEMLPLYPNGLVYDGIEDYSVNTNIPALTDFTYVFKRKLLDNVAGCASMTKGLSDQQRAVVIDYINTTGGINGTSFGNMAFVPSLRDSDIIYSTTTNINGTTITKGNNPDSNGIDIGKLATYYKKMVFYKLILYPKTIPLLQINFLKNLMERDEIIDLTNPIFIQE